MLRRAKLKDVKDIQALVNYYAKKNQMLALSLSDIYERVRSFFVYVDGKKILGCGALQIGWEDLGEIRSLAVHRKAYNRGIGKSIIGACLRDAKKFGLKRVFVLTYKQSYFKKLSFSEIDKNELPHKVWRDCVKCMHFPNCGEDALVIDVK